MLSKNRTRPKSSTSFPSENISSYTNADRIKRSYEKAVKKYPPSFLNRMDIQAVKKKINPILSRNNVEFAGVFGSYAKGTAKKGSDIDIVVRFSSPKTLFDLAGLQQELSKILRKKVDLGMEKSIHPYIRPNVAKDLKILYGQRRYL